MLQSQNIRQYFVLGGAQSLLELVIFALRDPLAQRRGSPEQRSLLAKLRTSLLFWGS